MPQLLLLYESLRTEEHPESAVRYVVAQFQGSTVDCGLFAAANAYLLLHGHNPQLMQLDQNQLRTHLCQCLQNRTVTSFPVIQTQQPCPQLQRYFTASFENMAKSRDQRNSNRSSEAEIKCKLHSQLAALRMRRKRQSEEFRKSENEKKHVSPVRDQSKSHKREKRQSEEFRKI